MSGKKSLEAEKAKIEAMPDSALKKKLLEDLKTKQANDVKKG